MKDLRDLRDFDHTRCNVAPPTTRSGYEYVYGGSVLSVYVYLHSIYVYVHSIHAYVLSIYVYVHPIYASRQACGSAAPTSPAASPPVYVYGAYADSIYGYVHSIYVYVHSIYVPRQACGSAAPTFPAEPPPEPKKVASGGAS